MNKGTGIAEQISPFYGTVIAEHSQYGIIPLITVYFHDD